MPGIAGMITHDASQDAAHDLDTMVRSLQHESFYVSGQFSKPAMGLYAGWSTHPGTLGESMPIVRAGGGLVLVMVGECFLQGSGSDSTNGNRVNAPLAQNIVRLLEQFGEEIIPQLNGWFAGVLIDLARHTVTLFNDRYGMSRLYLYEGENEFVFASEAKALLRIRPQLREIDPEGLGQFLRFNCVMGNKTLFKRMSLLPPASSWVFAKDGVPQKRSYFDFSGWEAQPTMDAASFYSEFAKTVSRVFPTYLRGPQSVGISLTAGLDTRAILACTKEEKQPLPCYTFGGPWGETYDIQTARKLAGVCGQSFAAVKINEGFLRSFPEYAQKSVYISDGTHDALGAHDVYFNEVAHQIAPVRLTGKFGSEVVRTRRLIPHGTFPKELLQPSFAPYVAEARPFEQVTQRKHPLTRVVAEEIPWYELGRVSVELAKVILRTPYMDNELVRLMYQAPQELRASRDLQGRYVCEKYGEIANVPTNLGRIRYGNDFVSKATYFPFWALFKVEYIYLYAAPHWLTRMDSRLSFLRLERVLAGRQKFEGYRIWMRSHLADFIRETLLNPAAKCLEFFDRRLVKQVVTRHLAGTHNYMLEINKMLTVELVYSSLLKA